MIRKSWDKGGESLRVQGIASVEERGFVDLGKAGMGTGCQVSRENERLGAGRGGMARKQDEGWCQGQGMGFGESRFPAMAIPKFRFPGMSVQGCPAAGDPTLPSPLPRNAPNPSAGATDGAALLRPRPQPRPRPQSRLGPRHWRCSLLPANGSWGSS